MPAAGCLDSVLRPVGNCACLRSPAEPGGDPSISTTASTIVLNQWAWRVSPTFSSAGSMRAKNSTRSQ